MATRKTGGVRPPPGTKVAKGVRANRERGETVPAEVAKQRILAAIRAIPPGSVSSYGEVARRAGLPGRARLTARILADNDDPSLPWHRVLRADGRIAMPEGSRGAREQRARLRAEGVVVDNGRVRAPRAPADIDELLWGPSR